MIEYPSDGLTITGIMQIPKNGRKPFPVIVMNHGFFSRFAFNSGDGTDRAAEFLNRRGYLTISSDYRSWGGSDIGPSLFYSGLVIDVINLLNSIPSIPEADYEHIGMWGHSMGGGVTFKVIAIDDRVKAAVLYSLRLLYFILPSAQTMLILSLDGVQVVLGISPQENGFMVAIHPISFLWICPHH